MIIYFYIFIIVSVILGTSFAYAGLKGAPWVPTRQTDVKRAMSLVNIKPGQTFYDLGCGDGRLLLAASKKGAQCIGFEISILPYLIAKVRTLSKKNIKIKYQNFFKADLSSADVVYIFLLPDHYLQTKQKLETELKPNTLVVAYVWPFKDWRAIKTDKQDNKLKLYLYKI